MVVCGLQLTSRETITEMMLEILVREPDEPIRDCNARIERGTHGRGLVRRNVENARERPD
jgi:hypothetical protein